MRLIDADAFIHYLKDVVKRQKYENLKIDEDLTVADVIKAVVCDLEGTGIDGFKNAPTIEPEPKPIEYQDCANALLKMWMDNVLTDGEYSKIISKLNAHLIEMAYKEGEQE